MHLFSAHAHAQDCHPADRLPDRKGIVVPIVNFLVNRYDVNILNADQHQDVEASSTGARSSKLVACVLSSILA